MQLGDRGWGWIVRGTSMALALACLPAAMVFGRAGYYRPPAGSVRIGRGGARGAMPHHNLGSARLPGGPVLSKSWTGGGGFGQRIATPHGSMNASEGDDSGFSSQHFSVPSVPYDTDERFEPPYYHSRHGYWLHGYWGGGLWGWGRWGGTHGIWSVPRWSMGPIYFPSGFGVYQNPFLKDLTGLTDAERNYAQPIVVIPDEPARPAGDAGGSSNSAALQESTQELLQSPQVAEALREFDAARDAFRKENYGGALSHVDAALATLPHDLALHQFRACILFMQGEYRRSAAALYSVLSVSPGFDWTTLSGFYADHATYTAGLRKLEAYRKAQPRDPAAAFLLSYHYQTCRQFTPALKQMQAAALLAKDDKLFAELAGLFQRAVEFESQPLTYGPNREERTSAEKELTEDANAGSEEIVTQDLVGTWSAQRGTATRIDFALQEDGTFSWTATSTGPAVHYAGKYAVSGERIVLSGSRGTVLAWVKDLSADRFRFQLVENDPADTGIEFTKEGSGPGN